MKLINSKKIISSILVVSLLNLVGCYSTKTISPGHFTKNIPPGYFQWIMQKNSETDDIIVNLKTGERYQFDSGNYNISNNSLTGEGFEIKYEITGPYDVEEIMVPIKIKIPLTQIKLIKFEEFDFGKTLETGAVIIGAVGFIYFLAASANSWGR